MASQKCVDLVGLLKVGIKYLGWTQKDLLSASHERRAGPDTPSVLVRVPA